MTVMDTSTLRGLVGKLLAPNVEGFSSSTARYRVLGYNTELVRVQSVTNQARSTLTVSSLEQSLKKGLLRIEDDSAA